MDNKNDFWSRIARGRELNARDSKEMTFKSELNPDAKSNLTADKQSQFIADRNYLDGKTDDLFAKAEPELKQDDLIVQPIEPDFTKMSAEEKITYEQQRDRAYRVMHSVDQPKPEVKTKQPTQEDLAFERVRSVFSSKPKKEISPEMKARLIQCGYMRPE